MTNFSLAHSFFEAAVSGVEAPVEGGKERAPFGFSCFVAFFGVLDVLSDGLLAVHILVVGDRVDNNVVVSPSWGSDEDYIDTANQNIDNAVLVSLNTQ